MLLLHDRYIISVLPLAAYEHILDLWLQLYHILHDTHPYSATATNLTAEGRVDLIDMGRQLRHLLGDGAGSQRVHLRQIRQALLHVLHLSTLNTTYLLPRHLHVSCIYTVNFNKIIAFIPHSFCLISIVQ